MTRVIESVEVLRFTDAGTGKLRKFYQVFIVSENTSNGTAYYVLTNWGPGAEGRPRDADLKGSAQHVITTGNSKAAYDYAARQVQEKLRKGYVLYTQYGSGASLPIYPKLADLLPVEPAAMPPESEKSTISFEQQAQSLATAFSTHAAQITTLLRGGMNAQAEAFRIRAALEGDLAEVKRVVIQCEAAYEVATMQLQQALSTPVASRRSA